MTSTFMDRPVFICGHRRSGTTLLLSLFENHPELLVYPAETGFFYAVYPPLFTDAHTLEARIQRTADFCIGNTRDILASLPDEGRRAAGFSIADHRADFEQLARKTDESPAALLQALVLSYQKQRGSGSEPKHWVEKTTSSEIYAADALSWFPQAKFIHVVRDPRDNWASLRSGWDVRFKYHNDSLERLMHSMIERGRFGFELAVMNVERFGPETYHVIRYEDLVADTRAVMGDVCKFLGISFSPELLRPTAFGQAWSGNNYLGTKFDGASSLNVRRWKERITWQEACLLEYHFEDVMNHFGYALCASPVERIDAAIEHYKWYNYAQAFSFATTQQVSVPPADDVKPAEPSPVGGR